MIFKENYYVFEKAREGIAGKALPVTSRARAVDYYVQLSIYGTE